MNLWYTFYMTDKKCYRSLVFFHASMQFSDSKSQKAKDVKKILSQGADIITGTEAGGANKDLRDILREECKKAGYKVHIAGDTWVAVHKSIIQSRWFRKGFVQALDSSDGYGKHTHRGITWVSFKGIDGLGKITVGAGHYLTKGRPGARGLYARNIQWNAKYAKAIGRWARWKAKGTALAFYGGDQNIVDKFSDTFFGEPLTSSWDELQKWQNTGHGNIDVIASYDKDARTEWVNVRAYNDKQLFLHTDHFLVKAVAKIRLLAA